MSLFFFHLRDHSNEVLDPDGRGLPDLEAVQKAVIEAACDVMSGDVRDGLIDPRYRIDAEDKTGAAVFSLLFEHAVSIIPATEADGGQARSPHMAEDDPRRPG